MSGFRALRGSDVALAAVGGVSGFASVVKCKSWMAVQFLLPDLQCSCLLLGKGQTQHSRSPILVLVKRSFKTGAEDRIGCVSTLQFV
eukprot:1157351-Pelagomonas_calceolata.AAC.7